jgi:hypothetical protein
LSNRHCELLGGSAGDPGVAGASRAFARIRADEALAVRPARIPPGVSPLGSRREGALCTSEAPRTYAPLRADALPIPIKIGALRLNAGERIPCAARASASGSSPLGMSAHMSRALRLNALCAYTAPRLGGAGAGAGAGALPPRGGPQSSRSRTRSRTARDHERTRATVPMTQRYAPRISCLDTVSIVVHAVLYDNGH